MAFRCILPPHVDKSLDLLSAAFGLSKQDMVKELVIAAVADVPSIRELMLRDFRAELAASTAKQTGKVPA